jgi:hypothetical protein
MSGMPLTDFVHSPLSNFRSIRLLELQPSSDVSSDICCKIHHVVLDNEIKYKALSYVWGDPNITLPVLVNEKRYYVTANCHAALCRLRGLAMYHLWVDAICINQKDDVEKATQIPLMKEIYSLAEEVVIWLGCSAAERGLDDQSNEKLAIDLIDELTTGDDMDFNSLVRSAVRRDDAEPRWKSWKAFSDLLNHAWFERLWIHQELVVSSAATAVFQYYTIPFPFIQLASHISSRLMDEADKDRYSILEEGMEVSFGRARKRLNQRTAAQLAYDSNKKIVAGQSLFEILQGTRMCKCFDPSDRVFALLGLVEYKDVWNIRIDYTQSVSELYTTMAWGLIQECQSLQIITHAGIGIPDQDNSTDVPSWVADWRIDPGKQPQHFFFEEYRAALDSMPMVSFYRTPPTLVVRGINVDSILASLSCNVPTMCLESGAEGLSLWGEHFCVYPGEHDPRQAYIRTICADINRVRSTKPNRLSRDLLCQFEALFRVSEFDDQGLARGVSTLEERKNHAEWTTPPMEVSWQYSGNFARSATMRRFFISQTGYMGLGPPALAQGDMICILCGCNVPVLIRKEDDHHLLVGECFVWGLMDGEILNNRKGVNYEVFRLR